MNSNKRMILIGNLASSLRLSILFFDFVNDKSNSKLGILLIVLYHASGVGSTASASPLLNQFLSEKHLMRGISAIVIYYARHRHNSDL
jgi:hypothetical protein